MPRTPVETAVLQSGNLQAPSMVASATRYPGTTRRVYRKPADWQTEAWRHFDGCGELRYACSWIGNVLSRVTLHAATREGRDLAQQTEGPAFEAVGELFSGKEGQSQMLSSVGVHLTVAGECYLVGRKPDTDRNEVGKDDIWEIVGTQEMKHRGQKWSIDYGDGLPPLQLSDSAVVIRIWRPHPRQRIEADSPLRALLPVLNELEYLSRHVMAQVTSRLTGGGILFLSQNMTFPEPPASLELPEDANDATRFMAVLGENMIAPIHDPSRPEAVVPVVAMVPDETVDKVNHLKFWSDLDQHAIELRSEAIRRLALGLDMPVEVLLGTAGMNHWGAWQMEESSIKAHIEPLLELVVNALTVGYLQPITEDLTDVIAYDTTALRLRPNRSKEAIELYDRGELKGEVLLRETGFSPDDKMDDDEFKTWMLRKVASGSTTPEQVADALVALGILGIRDTAESVPTEGRPAPSLLEHPETGPPEQQDQQAASLYPMSEVLVYRALERAGNRLRSLRQTRPECAAVDTYKFLKPEPGELDRLMEDAWGVIPRLLPDLPVMQQKIVAKALDAYTRNVLLTQSDHDREEMVRHLVTAAVRRIELP